MVPVLKWHVSQWCGGRWSRHLFLCFYWCYVPTCFQTRCVMPLIPGPINTINMAASPKSAYCWRRRPKSGQAPRRKCPHAFAGAGSWGARHEERDLVVLNERRVTPPGSIWGATRRDEAIFPQPCVAARLCTANTQRSPRCEGVRQHSRGSALGVRLVLRKNGLRRCHVYSVNRL